MSGLKLFLLGPFQAQLDAAPLTSLRAKKAKGLLAFLVTENDRAHRRDSLADLLWPSSSHLAAQASLRNALTVIRKTLNDRQADQPVLLITRDEIRLSPDCGCWVDVHAFLSGTKDSQAAGHLAQAIDLYRDDFLKGFALADNEGFNEWMMGQRERLRRRYISTLEQLSGIHEAQGHLEQSADYVRRQLLYEPWREGAHRRLMGLLVNSGRRSAALAQYEICRKHLALEFDIEPTEETTALYESIRSGRHAERSVDHPTTNLPTLRSTFDTAIETSPAPFVARDRELEALSNHLGDALSGHGRVVFVCGEAGSGKTALITEFGRRAMQRQSDLVTVSGTCAVQAGIGDPYLPFREIIQTLAGGVEFDQVGTRLGIDHSRRLRQATPFAIETLLANGAALVDRFVSTDDLVRSANAQTSAAGADTRRRLQALVQKSEGMDGNPPQQQALFEHTTRVLNVVAERFPLVLLLDDLQWADSGSISLLFHLGKHLAGGRILVVGAFRPEEVPQGVPGPTAFDVATERHPLATVVHEFGRMWRNILVDLDSAAGDEFVHAYTDSYPNRLGADFRKTLFDHTDGHALFTVEIMRRLQEQGDLVRDDTGHWITAESTLALETLPQRVEAVIAERIERLPADWQALLASAGIEGETFTAEIAAHSQGLTIQEAVGLLSGPLSEQHHLVRAVSVCRIGSGSQRLTRYQFAHNLFQRFLYNRLDPVARVNLHEHVATTLERLLAGEQADLNMWSPQLAFHFEAAGLADQAASYFLSAGRRAVRLSSHEIAVTHFRRGLKLLDALPKTDERDLLTIDLLLAVKLPSTLSIGWRIQDHFQDLERAATLAQEHGVTDRILPALTLLVISSIDRGEHEAALDLAQILRRGAEQADSDYFCVMSRLILGRSLLFLGRLSPAREQLELAEKLFRQRRPSPVRQNLAPGHNFESGIASWLSMLLYVMGFPDQARTHSERALSCAVELNHPVSQATTLAVAGAAYCAIAGDAAGVRKHANHLHDLSIAAGIRLYQALAQVYLGWAAISDGRVEQGVKQTQSGLANQRAKGTFGTLPAQLTQFATALLGAGESALGMSAIDEAIEAAEATNAGFYVAEMWRVRGELLLAGDRLPEKAEICFTKAIELARKQKAKMWELWATTSLARLVAETGGAKRRTEASRQLAEVYDWFDEGFDRPDLQNAKMLLEKLGAS